MSIMHVKGMLINDIIGTFKVVLNMQISSTTAGQQGLGRK